MENLYNPGGIALETIAKKFYEGMFLVDSGLAADDWNKIEEVLEKVLKKAQAEIVSFRKWDERKLAYSINRKLRGTYILVYFKAPGEKIQQIEHDLQLSEQIMRHLILNAEDIPSQYIQKETPVQIAEKTIQSREEEKKKEAAEPKAEKQTQETEKEPQKAEEAQNSTEKSEPEEGNQDQNDNKQTETETRET